MNNRELLELAAKAADVPWQRWDFKRLRALGHLVLPSDMWNPIDDDGDALRLAVALHINLDFESYEVKAGEIAEYTTMDYSIHAATRRAIVRAAAEIGKGMPSNLKLSGGALAVEDAPRLGTSA